MSKSRYENIAAAVYGSIWSIMPEKLQAIVDLIEAKVEGRSVDWQGMEAAAAAAEKRAAEIRRVPRVAILPLFGTISNRMNMLSSFSGGTSAEQFGRLFDEAIADDSITAVILDTDSPGGAVAGTPELASKIFAARGKKPIIAMANSLMASAAFWIGSAADEIVVTPSGQVGSVGVIAIHTETSRADRKVGVKTTLIYEGQYKAEGNPYEPLSDEALAAIKTRLTHYYGMFTEALATHRGLPVDQVRDRFGRGRVVLAGDAVERGMADRVATMETVLAELLAGEYQPSRSPARAVHDTETIKSSIRKDTEMADKNEVTPLTAESLKTSHPDVFKAVRDAAYAEGQADERSRFASIQKACGEDAVLAGECFAAGLTVAAALEKRTAKLTAENARLRDQLAKPTAGSKPVDKATAEFKEQPAPKTEAADSKAPQNFLSAVAVYQAEHKCDEADAMSQCVSLYPELHEAYSAHPGKRGRDGEV